MKARHRRRQRQAEARPRARSARLQPHEAVEHPAAIGIGDAGAAVGDGEHGLRPLRRDGDRHLARLALDAAIFQGIVDEVGDDLTEQFAAAGDGHRPGGATVRVTPASSATGS